MPLRGIRVVDLTKLAPGPHCTMILGDLGAEVIKVEEPGNETGRRASQAEAVSKKITLESKEYRHYNFLNRNKKSCCLNLKNDMARDVFYRLVKSADVIVTELRPGAARRLKIDYETLKNINDRLVYCAISGYGQTGPYAELAGHDINYISVSGALSMVRDRDGKPVIPHNWLGDFAGGGMHGALGIMAALLAREKTGKGQLVDISMTDGVLLLMAGMLAMKFGNYELLEYGDDVLAGKLPFYDVYCASDGRYISVGAMEPWFWANLCRKLGREDFVPYQYDESRWPEIREYFIKEFSTRPRDYWVEFFSQTDTCVAGVNSIDELADDPQIMNRKMIVDIDHPDGKVRQVGVSIKLSDTPGSIRSLPPAKGEHTVRILKEMGCTEEDIAVLSSSGSIE